jgi:hypothetical protein
MTLPGWESIETVSRFSKWFTVLGLVSLFFVALFDILAWVYSNRKDALTERENSRVQDVLKRQVDDVVRRRGARHLNEELFSERLKRGPFPLGVLRRGTRL